MTDGRPPFWCRTMLNAQRFAESHSFGETFDACFAQTLRFDQLTSVIGRVRILTVHRGQIDRFSLLAEL